MTVWGATQAKAQFSAVLDKAEEEGPQMVRRRKREFYILTREQGDLLLSDKASQTIKGRSRAKSAGTLGEFFRRSPLAGSGLTIERVRLQPRKIVF